MGGEGESCSGKVEVRSKVMRQMMKPMIFGNYQKAFKWFSWLVSAGTVCYLALKYDFGKERHCFSWIRDYMNAERKQFFRISPQDELLETARERQRLKLRTQSMGTSETQSEATAKHY